MFENRNLDRWHAAGLVDDDARARIRAWEHAHARPVWFWGLAGTGAFAIALGVVALVAANWAAIPGTVKIGGHIALDAALAAGVFVAWLRQWRRARELLAVLLFGFVLSGIGLVGQVYQMGGTAEQALLMWMLVCTPFLLLVTRSGLAAVAWALGAGVTYACAVVQDDALEWSRDGGIALLWMPVMALLVVGLLRGLAPAGKAQGHLFVAVGRIGVVTAASLPQMLLRLGSGDAHAAVAAGLGAGLAATVALLGIVAIARWRRGTWDAVTAGLATAGWLAWWLTSRAWTLVQPDASVMADDDGAQLAVSLIFIAFWMLVSWLALRSGRRGLFAAAFAVIAMRLFIYYWEAFGSLLSTGLGLVVGGLLCIGLAALGWRILRLATPDGVVR